MEHRVVVDYLDAARENFASTYLELAANTPESHAVADAAFRARVGTLDHPICNVALQLDLSPAASSRLAGLAADHHSLMVYRMPGDRPETAGSLLQAAGFQQVHELAMMVREPDARIEGGVEEALGAERDAVAHFMAKQFFGARPIGFRRRIAEATSSSSSLRLFVRKDCGKAIAAAMASEHGGILGIYNVCVSSTHRRRGLGSEMVRFALGLAFRRSLAATLQCDPALCAWYGRLGFSELGRIQVYGLCR